MFTDSIDGNLTIIKDLLLGVAPSSRERAKKAAVSIENAVTALQRDYPKDLAVALGAAFAIFALADRMIQEQQEGDKGKGLIKLLS